MKKVLMLCLGPKKSLLSPRLRAWWSVPMFISECDTTQAPHCFCNVELASASLVCSNPNQSNRMSAIQWYFPLWWVFSDFGLCCFYVTKTRINHHWMKLTLGQKVTEYGSNKIKCLHSEEIFNDDWTKREVSFIVQNTWAYVTWIQTSWNIEIVASHGSHLSIEI